MAYSIKTIWGLAKSDALKLTDDELYALIKRETNKLSMRKLTKSEIYTVCRTLMAIKDDVPVEKRRKRTDEGGAVETAAQRKKIYMLTGTLGWNNNNARINGFVQRLFKVERLEWLNMKQCHQLIETLKDMVARKEDKEAVHD